MPKYQQIKPVRSHIIPKVVFDAGAELGTWHHVTLHSLCVCANIIRLEDRRRIQTLHQKKEKERKRVMSISAVTSINGLQRLEASFQLLQYFNLGAYYSWNRKGPIRTHRIISPSPTVSFNQTPVEFDTCPLKLSVFYTNYIPSVRTCDLTQVVVFCDGGSGAGSRTLLSEVVAELHDARVLFQHLGDLHLHRSAELLPLRSNITHTRRNIIVCITQLLLKHLTECV